MINLNLQGDEVFGIDCFSKKIKGINGIHLYDGFGHEYIANITFPNAWINEAGDLIMGYDLNDEKKVIMTIKYSE